jgi:putative transcriptional regulator
MSAVHKGAKKPSVKKQYVSDATFAQIEESFKEAIAYASGERADLRTTTIHLPAKPRPIKAARILALRHKLNFSQAMFARFLNVSPKTVQAWEQGLRIPADAALRLLVVAEKHPEAVMDAE